MKKVYIFILALLYPAVTVSADEQPTRSCVLPGIEVVRHAVDKGIEFVIVEGVRDMPPASCRVSDHKAGASAVHLKNDAGPGGCLFTMFRGFSLSNGWTFGDVRFSQGRYKVSNKPKKGSSRLHIEIELLPLENRPTSFVLKNITLNGAKCDDWKDAF